MERAGAGRREGRRRNGMTGGARREAGATPAISFEFFPPKSPEQAAALSATIARLAPFRPHFVSVTYGAGGTSQERSFGAVKCVLAAGLTTAAHLTCAGASRAALGAAIAAFRAAGVDRFVALRGDPPGGLAEPYAPHPDGFRDTADLVRALKASGAQDVSVSAYPERHPQSRDWASELDALKRKIEAGADRAITQFFFDNDLYDRYVERLAAAGIFIPVVPGIMPIYRFAAVKGFAGRCGASVPTRLADRFGSMEPDCEAHRLVAAAVAAEQVADLIARGATAFHIYTLNRAELAEAICRFCGIVPSGERAAA
jgi:methylenetetrahydrofolate reductase (NADPH)